MNNNIYLHKSLKTHNISKNSNNSYSNIIKNYQPKYKVLNKYFRLEELKHEEKVSRFKDGFIDPTEKPNFVLSIRAITCYSPIRGLLTSTHSRRGGHYVQTHH